MGTLQVVATPIGNLEDVTLRALRILREADHLYAEDTRRVRTLLDRHGISAHPISLYSENEEGRVREILEKLGRDETVVLVSDAGTPVISDPGARVVSSAARSGHEVEGIPGPSAVLTALSVCGVRTHPFTFVGFLPRKVGARRKLLETYAQRTETVVIFEAPSRLAQTLCLLVEVFGGDRPACVARELTKLHEEVVRGDLEMLAETFSGSVRGEITLVVEGCEAAREVNARVLIEEEEVDRRILQLTQEGKRPREIAAQLSPLSDMPRREIYARAVSVREGIGPKRVAKGRSAE